MRQEGQGRQGDKGTRGQGDKGTRGQGDKGTRGQGDKGENLIKFNHAIPQINLDALVELFQC